MPDPTRPRCSKPTDRLRVERLEIVDASGRTRIVIGVLPGPDEAPGIAIYEETGQESASLALHCSGPQLSFSLGGNGVLDLGAADPNDPEVDAPGGFFYFTDPE